VTLLAICVLRWSSDLRLLALAKLEEGHVPGFDVSFSNSELKSFLGLVFVELGSVEKLSSVATLNDIAKFDEATSSIAEFLDCKFWRV